MAPQTSLRRVVDSAPFGGLVLAVIVANAVVLGLQTYSSVVRDHGTLLERLNEAFLAFFVVEVGIRVAAYGRRPQDFFRSGWNIFDFVVVAAAFVPGVRDSSTLLRLARLLRVVRIVRVLPDLRVLLQAVLRSVPPLMTMVVLTTLILYVYGIVGWIIFADGDPDRWGDIGKAMLTLFVMLTLEEFPTYMERGMEIHPWAWVYFVSFILVAAFIVLNVLIGIVLNSMEEAREVERRRHLGLGTGGGRDRADLAPAPVAERIAILRAALDELEQELGGGGRRAGAR